MTPEERTAKILECVPIVEDFIKSMRIAADLRPDVAQAGHLEVIQSVDKWDPSTPWEAFVHGWLRLSVTRNMLREFRRLTTPVAYTNLEELTASSEEDELADDSVLAGDPALVDNATNADPESFYLRQQLIDTIISMDYHAEARLILLGVLEGFSVSEMARNLQISQSKADRLYQQGVAYIREVLG